MVVIVVVEAVVAARILVVVAVVAAAAVVIAAADYLLSEDCVVKNFGLWESINTNIEKLIVCIGCFV